MFSLLGSVGFILDAQTEIARIGQVDEIVGHCLDGGLNLTSSAFHSVTAAFTTIGFYAHADLLEYVNGPFMKWATLIYLLAAFGGLAAMAFGQPPRNYLWFFFGPAVFHWLIGTTAPTQGVAWMIANEMQDQSQVWKHSEIGITQSGYWKRKLVDNSSLRVNVTNDATGGPDAPAVVAMPLLWLDAVVSDTVQQLTKIVGVNNQDDQGGGDWNLKLESPGVLALPHPYEALPERPVSPVCGDTARPPTYTVMSGLKWTYLNNIASAKISSPQARDAFTRFMSNECGDKFNEAVSPELFTAASNSKGDSVPESIMKDSYGTLGNLVSVSDRYDFLKYKLAQQVVPFPRSLRKVLSDATKVSNPEGGWPGDDYTGWLESVKWGESSDTNADKLKAVLRSDRIRCDTYLDILIYYLRYQAAEIFVQGFENANPQLGWRAKHSVYGMLYGWDLEPRSGDIVPTEDQIRFVQDLIFVHLVRNEMALVPKAYKPKHSSSQLVALHSESYNRTLGSVSKFAEVYTWALMMPYMQGIVLYLLAVAYPMACLFVVIPGWHKIIVTWMSFWVWAKLWDLGFAVVNGLERSIWAMLGNSETAKVINKRVMDMQEYGGAAWFECVSPNEDWYNNGGPCLRPLIDLVSSPASGSSAHTPLVAVADPGAFENNLALFDTALSLGANLDYDLANGYYIYIMAALYFAVPAVTGQMVLGAKAGAAGMVDRMASDPAQKGAGGATSGYQGAKTQQMLQNKASVSQAAIGKSYRKSGLADQALGYQNSSAEQGLNSSHLGQQQSGHQRLGNAIALSAQVASRNFAHGQALLTSALGGGANRKAHDARMKQQPPQDAQGLSNKAAGGGSGSGATTGVGGVAPDGQGGQDLGIGADGNPAANNALGLSRSTAGMQTGGYAKRLNDKGFSGRTGLLASRAGGALEGVFGKSNFEGLMGVTGAAHAAMVQTESAIGENQQLARGGAAGIAGHGAGQRSSGYRSAADRTGSLANFNAQQARYDALLGMADQMASESSIAGYMVGGLDPGARPDDMTGMAMKGMLNTNRHNPQARANFFNPNGGGFFKQVGASERGLNKAFGYSAVTGQLKIGTWSSEMNRGLGAAVTYTGKGLTGEQQTGYQQGRGPEGQKGKK